MASKWRPYTETMDVRKLHVLYSGNVWQMLINKATSNRIPIHENRNSSRWVDEVLKQTRLSTYESTFPTTLECCRTAPQQAFEFCFAFLTRLINNWNAVVEQQCQLLPELWSESSEFEMTLDAAQVCSVAIFVRVWLNIISMQCIHLWLQRSASWCEQFRQYN